MNARGIFVTGTDTGVGKTIVSVALVRGLVARGLRVAVMKPVASGSERVGPLVGVPLQPPIAAGHASPVEALSNEDARLLTAAANVAAPYEIVNPYCFEPAISPHIAANDVNIQIDLDTIVQNFEILTAISDYVVVEGAGGWLAPIGTTASMADLAAALNLPVLLVVGLRLGCINHAALTKLAIDSRGTPFAGWVANSIDPAFARRTENLATLERVLTQSPLAVAPFMSPGAPPLELEEAAIKLLLSA